MLNLGKHETVIITALRKAAEHGKLEIPCGSLSSARALRAQAYALAKKVRSHVEKHPGDVNAIDIAGQISAISMSITGTTLVMRRKDQLDSIIAAEAALAAIGEKPIDPDQQAILESAERLRKMMEGSNG